MKPQTQDLADAFSRQWRDYQERLASGRARRLEELTYVSPALYSDPSGRLKKGGVIYVVQVADELYKIGRTTDIGGRLRSLNVGRLERVKLIHLMPTKRPVSTEKAMHERFAAYHVKNELFALTAEAIAEICALTEND